MVLKMRKMKASGIEWIGEIPEGWEVGQIGQLYSERRTKVSDKDYPPLSVTMKGILPQLSTAAKTDAHDDRKLACKGDFAINSRSDRRGSCGISEQDGSISLINTVLQPRGEMNPGYYNWLFHTSMFADEFYKWGHGIVDDLWTTGWSDMKKISVPVPSKCEQKQLAEHLNVECSNIDSILSKTRSSIEEYKKLKQAVITQAVTKGVRGKREMKDSGVDWIGEIPKEWSTPKIKRLHNGLTDGTHGTFNRIDSGHILLSSKNVREFGIQLGENESFISEADYNLITANGFPQKDDVLLCCIGASIGRCTLYEFEEAMAFQRSVIFIRCNSLILPRMMMYDLRSSNTLLQEQLLVNQSAQAGLYQGLVSEIFISLPPISEQKEIIAYLDAKCAEIDRLIAKKEQLVKELESYKKSLIYEVVTGKQEV